MGDRVLSAAHFMCFVLFPVFGRVVLWSDQFQFGNYTPTKVYFHSGMISSSCLHTTLGISLPQFGKSLLSQTSVACVFPFDIAILPLGWSPVPVLPLSQSHMQGSGGRCSSSWRRTATRTC